MRTALSGRVADLTDLADLLTRLGDAVTRLRSDLLGAAGIVRGLNGLQSFNGRRARRTLESARDRADDLERDLASVFCYADLILAAAPSLDLDLDAVLALGPVHRLESDSILAVLRGFGGDLPGSHASDVNHIAEDAFRDMEALAQAVHAAKTRVDGLLDASQNKVATAPVVARSAGRLAGWTVRVLPATDRARYREEFDSELWELAAAGVPRLHQLLYAVRLLSTAWWLRSELKAPRRRRAVS